MAFPTGWSLLGSLTIQATEVPGALSDFAVLVTEVITGTDIFGSLRSDGGDMRFSSDEAGSAQLAAELHDFDDTTSAEYMTVFVRIPSISSTVGTVFYIWGDAASETYPANGDTYGRDAVWDSGYIAVHHAGQADEDAADSTGNGWDMTNTGTTIGQVDGAFGKASSFLSDNSPPGNTEKLESGLVGSTDTTDFTIETWANAQDTFPTAGYSIGIGAFTSNEHPMVQLWDSGGGTNVFRGWVQGKDQKTTAFTLVPDEWYSLAWSRDDSLAASTGNIMYVDGVPETVTSVPTGNRNYSQQMSYGHTQNPSGYGFYGYLQEHRFSDVIRSGDYLAANYTNQSDPSAFIVFAEPAAGGIIPQIMHHRQQQGSA